MTTTEPSWREASELKAGTTVWHNGNLFTLAEDASPVTPTGIVTIRLSSGERTLHVRPGREFLVYAEPDTRPLGGLSGGSCRG